MTSFQYVVIVADEPIPGVPSHRIYGLFRHRDDGWNALKQAGIVDDDLRPQPPFVTAGVLPMRLADELERERREP